MSRRRRRSPAPRGRLRSMFARRAARAAAPRSARWRQSYQTPAARSPPAGCAGRSPARPRARFGPRATSPSTPAATARQPPRRLAQRGDLVVVLPDARALDDAFGRRRARRAGSVGGERRRQPVVAARRSGAPPRSRRGASGMRREQLAPASRRTSHRPSPARGPGTRARCRASRRATVDVAEVGDEVQAVGGRATTIAELPVKLVR